MRHVAKTLLCGLFFGPGLLAAAGCFNPPAEPVQFACDMEEAAECPAGYECRIDGCCHREDTPDDDSLGACKLGSGASGASSMPPPGPPASTGDDSTTGSSSSDSATDATSDTSATTTTGTTSTDTSTGSGPGTTADSTT